MSRLTSRTLAALERAPVLRLAVRESPTTGAPCDWWLTQADRIPPHAPGWHRTTLMRLVPMPIGDAILRTAMLTPRAGATGEDRLDLLALLTWNSRTATIRDAALTETVVPRTVDDPGQHRDTWRALPESLVRGFEIGVRVIRDVTAERRGARPRASLPIRRLLDLTPLSPPSPCSSASSL